MGIVKLPNGEWVNVADGTTPERLQQIMAEHPARKAAAPRPQQRRPALGPVNTEQAEVASRVAKYRTGSTNSGVIGGLRDFAQGFTANFMDEAVGGVRAAGKFITSGGDTAAAGREYRVSRDVIRQEDRERHAQGGIGGTAAEIAGALASPVGLIGKGVKAGAAALGLGKAAMALPGAARVAGVASRASQPVVARAALAGAGQGALNGLGVDESGTVDGAVGNTLSGATVGGIAGGVLGGAAQGAQRGVQVIRDRSAARAGNTAYGRIADLLGKAPRTRVDSAGVPRTVRRPDGSVMTHTPESAARELAVANGRGSDAVVGDLSNGLQILSGKTARNAESMGANAMVVRSEGRMAGRAQEVEDQIAGRIQPTTGTDAFKFQQSNTGARKAAGQRDYEGVLDKPIAWTPQLDEFVTKPNPLVRQAMSEAERLMRSQDIDPKQLGMIFGPDGVLQGVERPTMRTFDYMKRGLDRVTRMAKDAKDGDGARIAGEQANALRDMLGAVNPEYSKVLATQRSYFQQDAAAELGKSVVSRLQGARANPRELLQDIQQVHPNDRDALRTGFADALISLRDTKTAGKGPVAVLQAMTRSPNQRKVLENLFEGRGNLGRFERWLGREVRAAKTDAKVAGPQSVTSENMMNSVNPGGDIGGLAMDTLRGVAYGGPTGAVSAGIRKIDNLANSTSAPVNDEIARILMSRGDDLVAGVGKARAFQTARKAANRRRATRVARGAQQPFTDTLED